MHFILLAVLSSSLLIACGKKGYKVSTKSKSLQPETPKHPTREGHQTMLDTDETANLPELEVADISVQSHRKIGDKLEVLFELVFGEYRYPVRLEGALKKNATADLSQVLRSGEPRLAAGVALCIDVKECRHVVIDVYYRGQDGVLNKKQFESYTPKTDELEVSDTHFRETPGVIPPSMDGGDYGLEGGDLNGDTEIVDIDDGVATETLQEPFEPELKHVGYRSRPPQKESGIEALEIFDPKMIPEEGFEPLIPTVVILKNSQEKEQVREDEDLEIMENQEQDMDVSQVKLEYSVQDEVRMARAWETSEFLDFYERQAQEFGRSQNQAFGKYNNGYLVGSEKIVRDRENWGIDWLERSTMQKTKYATSLAASFLEFVATKFNSLYPDYVFGINRLSLKNGRRMSYVQGGRVKYHVTHQNGLDIDLAYPHSDSGRLSLGNIVGSNDKVIQGKGILERTWDLLKIMTETGVVNRFHIGRRVKEGLVRYARSIGEFQSQKDVIHRLCPASGHDNHLHVKLMCTDFNARCIEASTPPDSSCPSIY